MFLLKATDIPDPELDAQSKARVERQLAALQEIAEVGLDLVRVLPSLQREPGADPAAIALAYSRLSRSIRLTFTLETQIAEGRLAVERQVRARCARQAEHERQAPFLQHRYRIENLVDDHIQADGDEDRREAVEREACERFDELEQDETILGRSVADIVAEICKTLGVTVDPALFDEDDLVPPQSAHSGEGQDPGQTQQRPPDHLESYDLGPDTEGYEPPHRGRQDERSDGP